MNKNSQVREFPLNERDYLYFFEIKNIDRALKSFEKVTDTLILQDAYSEKPNERKQSNKLGILKNDFSIYANKLIHKEDINSYEDYQNNFDLLLVIIFNTIELIEREYYSSYNKKIYKLKNEYDVRRKTLRGVMGELYYIASILDPIPYEQKYGYNIIIGIIIGFFIIGSLLLDQHVIKGDSFNFAKNMGTTFILLASVFTGYSIYNYRSLKVLKVTNENYRRKYKYIYHPNKMKKSFFESIMDIIKFLSALYFNRKDS